MRDRNYEVSSRISHDLVNFSWNLELEDEVFISEILESVTSNLVDMFRNYSVPKEIEKNVNSEILSKLKSVMDTYPNKDLLTLYDCLKQLRYITTLHQLTIWRKFDKPRKNIAYGWRILILSLQDQPSDDISYEDDEKKLWQLNQEISEKNVISIDSLFHAYLELGTLVRRLLLENKSLTQLIQQNLADTYVASINIDNFELDKTGVKKLLLREIKIGEVFYPSDICDKYGLDLKIVVDVISELKQQGRFTEKI